MTETLSFTASTSVPLSDPLAMLERLCDHMTEHGSVTRDARGARFESLIGAVELEAGDGALHLRAASHHLSYLFIARSLLAEHIVEFAEGAAPAFLWSGDGCDSAAIPYFHLAAIRSSRRITPRMQRVTLAVEDVGRLETGGLHVRVLIPPQGRAPVWPSLAPDGRVLWPKGEDELTTRVYTIRNVDHARGEVDIDVVLHEDSAGSVWARSAGPGDPVGLMGPGGGEVVPADCYLLGGDETALPVIARFAESLPAGTKAILRIEVADAQEEQPIRSAAELDVRWLHRNGAEAGSTDLLERAIRAVEWPQGGEPYALIGSEQASARAIRTYLRKERGMAKDRHLVAAYWRRGHAMVEHERD